MPEPHYLVYDTGHWNQDNLVFQRVQEVIPADTEIDLLLLSHSDSDHLAATDEILAAYTVRKVLRGDLERETGTWGDSTAAIRTAHNAGTTLDLKRAERAWVRCPGPGVETQLLCLSP